jgi:hypothetical protein
MPSLAAFAFGNTAFLRSAAGGHTVPKRLYVDSGVPPLEMSSW